MVRIEILAGPESGRVVELGPGTHSVGRAAGNDLRLEVDAVSGRHLELTVAADGTVRFRDLGSTNGTFSAGVRVEEGEWFPGSELRLGSVPLRLVAEDVVADADARARRAEALSGGRRGGPALAVLALLLVAGAGAAWWFLGRGGGEDAAERSGVDPQGAPVAEAWDPLADSAEWRLAGGVAFGDGALEVEAGGGAAALTRTFDVEGGGVSLRLEGTLPAAVARVAFGADDEAAQPWGRWAFRVRPGAAATLALPEGARWFRVSLALDGPGRLTGLVVEPAEAAAERLSTPVGAAATTGANLALFGLDRAPLLVLGSADPGAWTPSEGELTFDGAADFELRLGPKLHDAAIRWVFADGGPLDLAPGVAVDDTPGLLLGDEGMQLLFRTRGASHLRAGAEAAELRVEEGLTLRWDLSEDRLEAARLARDLEAASRAGDDARILELATRLLRDYPLDEEKIQTAQAAMRDTLARGRAALAALEDDVSGALFLGSVDELERLARAARGLARRFGATPLGAEAEALAAALDEAAGRQREAARVREAAYRARVLALLRRHYPMIASWALAQGEGADG